jgi:mono/diheme cytochrome c family protein
MKSEGRNPRAEGGEPRTPRKTGFGTRISEPGLLWVLGFRVSDLTVLLLLSSLSLLASGCRPDMFEQPSSRPLEKSAFFRDQMASRLPPSHTVAQGQLRADTAFYSGRFGTNLLAEFPLPVTREVLVRGRERFEIYCSPCHGRTGDGNGMIVQRGFPAPPSYHIERLRQAPVGHFYDVITQGYGIMYSYAARVKPEDRWAIAAYIRALQLSQDGRLADVPPNQRAQMEKTQP